MSDFKQIKQPFFHIALIGAFSIAVMASSFYYGITSSNDLGHHLELARVIYDSVASGEIYPSLSGQPNQGYGDVTVRFYPPFSYYVLSASRLLVGNWFDACRLTFFLLFWTSGIGIYFWAKEEFSPQQALLAAGLYIFAPYHINQIYNNFFYPEFTAAAIIPFCFLYLTRACRRGKSSDVLGLSISYALLIITHLPLTVIGSLVFAVYALALLKRNAVVKTFFKLAVSATLAAASTSFYWLRMITELSWVNLSNKDYYSATFDYRENFLINPQNVLNFYTDSSCLWLAELMLFAVILISAPSIFFLIKERKNLSVLTRAVAVIFFVSVFMTSPPSKFVWDNLAFLQKVQFPWRWLAIVSMSGAVFSSIGLMRAGKLINENKNRLLTFALGFILTCFVFVSTLIVKEAFYMTRAEFDTRIANIQSNSFDNFWWTIWAKPGALTMTDKLTIENRSAEILKWNSTDKEFDVSAGKSGQIRVAAFYYPHWQATVNGEPAEVEKSADGAILIALPADASRVILVFREPLFVKIANVVSLSIWIVFALGGCFVCYRKFRSAKRPARLQTL